MTTKSKPVPKKESWMQSQWRPMMAMVYMIVILFDFMFGPILWSLVQAISFAGTTIVPWHPLTLEGGGLFHVAMGSVLGISALTRGQEKIKRIDKGVETSANTDQDNQ